MLQIRLDVLAAQAQLRLPLAKARKARGELSASVPSHVKRYSEERELTVVGTSGYLFVVIAGAFLGYLCAGFVHDRIVRRMGRRTVARVGRVCRSPLFSTSVLNRLISWASGSR